MSMLAAALPALAQGVETLPEDHGPLPWWIHGLKAVAVFGFLLVGTAMLIWGERRIVARMQARIGPNRAGPAGLFQTLADGAKLFFKEDLEPQNVDRAVYYLAPLFAPITALLAFAIVPFGGTVNLFGHTFDLQVFDPDVGALWFLAMGSIHVYGVVLAGWSSGSAYPLLGGVRSTAQMISYEIALGLGVAAVFVYAGTLRISEIVAQQAGPGLVLGVPNWFLIPLFPAFVIFLVALTAETARPPFDLPEAEGELVAGFHTEYSGIKFAMFFLGEFMAVITGSAVVVTLFLGGPAGPDLTARLGLTDALYWLWPIVWFFLKTFVFIFMFVWLRATLPRIRYDRLMHLGWNVMLPLGLVWVLATGFMVTVNEQLGTRQRVSVAIGGIAAALLLYLLAPLFSRQAEQTLRRPRADDRTFDDPEMISTHAGRRSP
ncbi:MAG: NADH-quinone oxidoreductase subunit H [Actinomycetota bacterium]|nr:NADH-quinone oxidoreductase subunit H [Actinomycetota bacterium]